MKLNLKLPLLLLLFISSSIFAQKSVNISGTVIDAQDNFPLEYATISFITPSSQSIVTGGITDMEGNFNIEVPQGTYDIKVEFISYLPKIYKNKTLNRDMNLGTVSLEMNTETLDEIEIIAETTTVDIKLDKKIYNVGKDLTVRGGTVSDVLDNVPSVSVDVEGNVSLRGQDNVRILINGKPSGLVGLNSTDALRQLPAESIERVEVITSPSARYDAEGTAGILNIILRRSKLQGLNGAITANAGYPNQAGISGNINYRTGDFNFFNTTGYSYRESPGESTTETEYFNDGSSSSFLNEYRDFDRERKGINTNFGVEWYITNSASLTAAVFYRKSDDDDLTTNKINQINTLGVESNSERLEFETEDDKTIQYSLNFDKQFNGNSQHKLTADFQYESSNENEFASIQQNSFDSERVTTLQSEDRVLLQTDYVYPINEKSQFELGYRGNFNLSDTDYTLELNDGTGFEIDQNTSNNLIYKEHINAVYAQYGNKLKDKFSYLLGLRMENTRITIEQITSNDFQKKQYTGLFPTVNLGYEITEDQSLTLGYNRRIRRPRSRFINPFPSRSSATNLFQGNADLDPTYSNTFDLGYLNKFGKLTLNSSIYFQHATDVFTFITQDSGTTTIVDGEVVPVILRTPINLASEDRYGFEFTLTYRPNKKWNMNGNFNLFQSSTKGTYNNVVYDNDNLSWFIRFNNKYTLPGNIDWQTRLFYRGPREDAQSKSKGIFSTDMAFSKDLFDSKASIALSVNDLFNSRKRQTDSYTETFDSYSEFQWRKRSVNLSFTYRFNQQNRQQRKGGINGGNGGEDFDFEG